MSNQYPPYQRHVFICMNERKPGDKRGDCCSKGAAEVLERFKQLVAERGLRPAIRAQKCGCLNTCEQGVSVVVYPEGVWYRNVKRENVDEIVQSHLIDGRPVKSLLLHPATSRDSGPVEPIGNA